MEQHRYWLAGFELASEFALPLPACPSGMAAMQPAVRVYRGAAPMLSAPSVQRLLLQVASHDYWLEIPQVARYRVRGGREIVVEVAPGALTSTVAAYLCSYALAALCCQRGLLVVHATALGWSDQAILLVGSSGCGKTTLGAFMAARGARALSDDLCIIDTVDECALAQPSDRWFNLWPDSAARLSYAPPGAHQPIAGVAKRAIEVGAAETRALPVRLVLLLREARSPQPKLRLEPFRPLDALVSLAGGAGLAALLQGMNRAAAHLEQCRRLITQARACQIVYPRTFEELPRVAQLIEELATDAANGAQVAEGASGLRRCLSTGAADDAIVTATR